MYMPFLEGNATIELIYDKIIIYKTYLIIIIYILKNNIFKEEFIINFNILNNIKNI